MAFFRLFYKTPTLLRFLIGAICGTVFFGSGGCVVGIFAILIINIFAKDKVQTEDIKKKCESIKKNPTNENVKDLVDYLNKINNQKTMSAPELNEEMPQLIMKTFRLVTNSNNVSMEVKESFLDYMAMKKYVSYNAVNLSNYDNFMQEEINRQNMEWAMEETRKAGTPFDMGGYMQGDGFNPSDTMVADAQREQMNQMNNMNMF